MADSPAPSNYETPADVGLSPQAVCRRWKLELKLADKREREWRKRAKDANYLYSALKAQPNSFNILWSNTETLRQACYNSPPQPQVRRRYQDADPLGKAVSECLQRSLEFSIEAFDFDETLKSDVLSMLLAGRAVSRVRYVPSLRQVGGEAAESDDDEAQESEAFEEIEWEQVVLERVQWDDFRIGPGKQWGDVCWLAFRHYMDREELKEKFGDDIGGRIGLDSVGDDDINRQADLEPLFKTASVWEIWDRDKKQVIWIADSHDVPCKTQEDPLGLQNFYPIARPLLAIERHDSTEPLTLYSQYEQQARELNRISVRINKLIDALRVRGVYDATLTELSELMKAADNELIPAQNATMLTDRGGLEKAIWMMPIDTAAKVLNELYSQREATKAVIYEITGISDIMRSATDATETYGAQKLKTQWGTQRLQKLQSEVQRYVRDLMRLMAEIVAEKFQPETLERMTLMELPHDAEVQQQLQQMSQQWQQAAMQAQAQNQPPPPQPQPPQTITWEMVIEALRDEAQRNYRVDIETDSTLSATQDADIENIGKLMQGVTQMLSGLMPFAQAGAMPIDAIKEIILAATRRAKLGTAVEDALDKIQQPPPSNEGQQQAQLEQAKLEAQAQQHAAELQATQQLEQMKAQMAVQVENAKQAAQDQQAQRENAMQAEREHQKMQMEAQANAQRVALESEASDKQREFERWKVELDAATRIMIAQIAASSNVQPEAETAADDVVEQDLGPSLQDMHAQTLAGIQQLVGAMARPKRVVRGADGRVVGVE